MSWALMPISRSWLSDFCVLLPAQAILWFYGSMKLAHNNSVSEGQDKFPSPASEICWGNKPFMFVPVLQKAKKMQLSSLQVQFQVFEK